MRILRVLGSGLLPCQCFAGMYETYDGETATIIDERAESCPDPGHRVGAVVPEVFARLDGYPVGPVSHTRPVEA